METIYSIKQDKTFMVKLKAKTEAEADAAYELIQQLDGMIGGFEFEQFLVMWTPGAGAKLYAIDSTALPSGSMGMI